MEDALCGTLGCSRVETIGGRASGCISSGQGYATDTLGEIFVKVNTKEGSEIMCQGEFASLQAMEATSATLVPHPIKAVNLKPYGWALITSYIHMGGRGSRNMSEQLAINLAGMHLHNASKLAEAKKNESFVGRGGENQPVEKFGFDVPTCCGFIPQVNDWQEDWATFFVRQRLKPQIDRILENKSDRDLMKLWPELEKKSAQILKNCEGIVPSLVHGDLWSGNWSTTEKEPGKF
ncbi:hypothetical protein WR25_08490 [Diploscapter pachys]|uniref:protein-ribulosamine 3-kinase n=1 Tax=Diploscapter pachys TaxID=2018661 RepID=A0A2A2LFE9_9BILA|nr:hypothetical protein WR25_08490 [Diploscapter pachys]